MRAQSRSRKRGQLALPIPNTWGGRRAGAGRKPKGDRAGVPHRARAVHLARHPIHVTLRVQPGLPNLRGARVFPGLRAALAAASGPAFRLVHFSVQGDHLHLLVEAADREALMRGAKGLAVRAARAVNRALGRRGRVWGDRYHAHTLTTPREVRNALVYLLTNFKKHGAVARAIDLASSGPWFDGWRHSPGLTPPGVRIPPAGVRCPVVPPRTWLLREGWRRHGLIAAGERPKQHPAGLGPGGKQAL